MLWKGAEMLLGIKMLCGGTGLILKEGGFGEMNGCFGNELE